MRALLMTGIICCGVGVFAPLMLEMDAMAAHECKCGGCEHGACRVDLCTCSVHCACVSCCHEAELDSSGHSSRRLAAHPNGNLDLR